MLNQVTVLPQYQPPLSKAQPFPVNLLKIDGIGARSVQKTPANTLLIGTTDILAQKCTSMYFFGLQVCRSKLASA